MWLIVGLGNPGNRYARTRHNIGFRVLEEFAERHRLICKERRDYKIFNGSIENAGIILLEPLTFMNRSGTAVKKITGKFSIAPESIIVIHDDLDMETGKLKIRRKSSAGGHRGVESIIQAIGSSDFIRIKIGIGRDKLIPPENYVLRRFRRNELPLIREAIKVAGESIHTIVTEGVEKAMGRFNTR